MVVAVTGFIDMFKDMGLATVTVQREQLSENQLSALFWMNVAIGALLTLVTAALAPVVSWGYGKAELTNIMLALSSGMLLGSLSIQHQALLRRRFRFERVALIEIVSSLVSSIAAVIAALAGLGLWALVIRQLARPLVAAIVAWFSLPWAPGWPRRAPVRDLVSMGGHLTGFQVTNYAERNLDDVLIGKYAGAFDLGCYARAYDLLRLPLAQIGAPASTVALPALSRLASDRERYRDMYLRMLGVVLLLTVPICPYLVICADWLIELAFGSQWSRAVPIFQWLGIGLIVKPISFTTSWLFVSQGRSRELMRWGVFATIVAVVSYVGGLRWGAVGVAAAYSILDLVVRTPILFAWVGKEGPVRGRDLLAAGVPNWLAAAVAALALFGLRSALPADVPAWLGAVTGALLTVVATLLVMWFVPAGRRALGDLSLLVRRRAPEPS